MARPLAILLALAGLAAFGAAWPAVRRLVTPNVFLNAGQEEWALRWSWVLALALLAVLAAQRDAWMGALIGTLAPNPLLFDAWPVEMLVAAVLGVGAVWCASATARQRGRIILGLAWLGLLQSLVVLAQWRGFDPLVDGLNRSYPDVPGGTFAHPGTAGTFLALTGILAPWWMLLLILPAAVATTARSAVVALFVGILLRVGLTNRWGLALGAVGVLLIVLAMARTPDPLLSVKYRASVHGQALAHMLTTAPVVGLGFGRWPEHKHAAKAPRELNGPVVTTLNPLHNDLLQWIVETGIGGAVALIGFLVALARRMRAGGAEIARMTPALAGALILSVTWYPLHMVPTGAVVATLLGCATPLETQGA